MKAMTAAQLIMGYCQALWPDDAVNMSTTAGPMLADNAMSVISAGSHKYLPTSELNKQLGLQDGNGVFGYSRFADKSYLLYTTSNGLAVWGGEDDFSSAQLIGLIQPAPPLKIRLVKPE